MEDIISQLPDDLLISIVTLTPTKEAVRTSILSRKWRNIYKFVSAVNISCHCYYLSRHWQYPGGSKVVIDWRSPCDSKVIIDGLHRVLQLHSGFMIRSFECRCCLTESFAHKFEECIYSLGKGIEKLVLQFSCSWRSNDFTFPCHLLSHMPSLEYFKLRYCSLQPNLNTHCNSLKTLRLTKVRVLPGSLECILANCLSLCSLLIKRCELPPKLCFCGPNLQLKCILIRDCGGDVEEIELYASNLITFEFSSLQMVNFIFDYAPQLQNIYLFSFNNTMSCCAKLGRDLPCLKSLLLDIQEDIYEDGSISMGINMFSNLTRLELSTYFAGESSLLSLTPLLHSCPLLQEFHLATMASVCYGSQVEKCVVVHSQLKKVDITGFYGTEDQMDFVLYILKIAVGLQQMHISWHCSMYFGFGEWAVQENPRFCERWRETMRESIEQLKHRAASETVQVIFEKLPRIKSKQFTEDGILVD